jgi:hypothetical protein
MDTLEDYYMIGTYDDAMDAFVPTEAERWDDYQNDLEVLDDSKLPTTTHKSTGRKKVDDSD